MKGGIWAGKEYEYDEYQETQYGWEDDDDEDVLTEMNVEPSERDILLDRLLVSVHQQLRRLQPFRNSTIIKMITFDQVTEAC